MRWDRPTEAIGRSLGAVRRRVRSVAAAADEAGQGIVEYGLILSGSALFAVVVLVFFGGTLSAVLQAVGDAIDAAT
jgi:Flp pilus assembly pilin Flp